MVPLVWPKVPSNLSSVSRRLTPERIAGLVEGAASVAGQVELSGLLRSTVEIARELTGARYAALGVIGEQGGLVDFIFDGMGDEADEIDHYPSGSGVLGVITSAGKTVRMDNIADHPDAAGFPKRHPQMTSFLGVPVRLGDRIFGNLYLTDKEGGFTEEDEILVEFLAVTAGSAVSTLRLQERLRRWQGKCRSRPSSGAARLSGSCSCPCRVWELLARGVGASGLPHFRWLAGVLQPGVARELERSLAGC